MITFRQLLIGNYKEMICALHLAQKGKRQAHLNSDPTRSIKIFYKCQIKSTIHPRQKLNATPCGTRQSHGQ